MTKEPKKYGTLYIVGTPLGNLEDITLRALRTLKEVDLIAAEDTRVSQKLLSHYSISTPTISFHEHSPPTRLQQLISEMLAGKDVGLISDAGMPAISDPGERLVAACLQQGIEVIPIPGPSAVITALAVSGLPTREFTFIGFIPRQSSARRKLLGSLANEPRTLVLYEAPHRLIATLQDLRQELGNRQAVAARELTKKFEEIVRGSLDEIIGRFAVTSPRGEFTLVIEGAATEKKSKQNAQDEGALAVAIAEAQSLIARGLSIKEAAREIAAATGIQRRLIYNALLKSWHELPAHESSC